MGGAPTSFHLHASRVRNCCSPTRALLDVGGSLELVSTNRESSKKNKSFFKNKLFPSSSTFKIQGTWKKVSDSFQKMFFFHQPVPGQGTWKNNLGLKWMGILRYMRNYIKSYENIAFARKNFFLSKKSFSFINWHPAEVHEKNNPFKNIFLQKNPSANSFRIARYTKK